MKLEILNLEPWNLGKLMKIYEDMDEDVDVDSLRLVLAKCLGQRLGDTQWISHGGNGKNTLKTS